MKLLPLLAGVLVCARPATAQVDAMLQLHGADGEMRVQNPTRAPLRVSITLYRNAPGTVPLGDSVAAQISPQAFVLAPGAMRVVRLRVRARLTPHELLRLAVTFTPADRPPPGMRIALATRVIAKVIAP
jgi:hypothetical protein